MRRTILREYICPNCNLLSETILVSQRPGEPRPTVGEVLAMKGRGIVPEEIATEILQCQCGATWRWWELATQDTDLPIDGDAKP